MLVLVAFGLGSIGRGSLRGDRNSVGAEHPDCRTGQPRPSARGDAAPSRPPHRL